MEEESNEQVKLLPMDPGLMCKKLTVWIRLSDLLVSTNDSEVVSVGDKAAEDGTVVLGHINARECRANGNGCSKNKAKCAYAHCTLQFYKHTMRTEGSHVSKPSSDFQ